MHESLKVYLKDSFVGWLSHESAGDEFSFKYDDSYLANPIGGALSFALPLGTESFDSVRTYRFFANLLPPQVIRHGQRTSSQPSETCSPRERSRPSRESVPWPEVSAR